MRSYCKKITPKLFYQILRSKKTTNIFNMAFKLVEMESLISELTCIKCNKWLSVFPIYTSPTGNVCGRCTGSIGWMNSNKYLLRCTAYESLAKAVLFPCFNRALGCETSLTHEEVVHHEKYCSYRPRSCPFPCDWKGGIINVNTHLDLNHKSSEITNPHTFVLNVEEIDINVYYVKVDLETFIVLTHFNDETKKFRCLVMCCEEEEKCKNYSYQLELVKGDFRLIYPKSNLGMLIETSEALQIVENMIVIDMVAITSLCGDIDSDLNCKLTIVTKTNEIALLIPKEEIDSSPETSIANGVSNPSVGDRKLMESNKSMLKKLECPVCDTYMEPPIYICVKGHSLCNECKEKVNRCPVCGVYSLDIRNFALETLAEEILYPCQYTRNGCEEILNREEIVKHQFNCKLRTDCPLVMSPLSCNVKEGILNPISHIYERHSKNLFHESKFCRINLTKARDKTIYNVTVSDAEIFFIVCYRPNEFDMLGLLKLNFLHLGQKTNVSEYMYVLEFTYKNTQLTVKRKCQAVPSSISGAWKDCFTVHMNTIESYMAKNVDGDDILRFQFKIVKI